MVAHVSHVMELYSPAGVLILKIFKLKLRSDHEEGNSRMFAHVSNVMELY